MSQTYQAQFCAICCGNDEPLHWEPLGRDNANVAVCESCASEHPRSGNYSFDDSSRCAAQDRQPFGGGHDAQGRVTKTRGGP